MKREILKVKSVVAVALAAMIFVSCSDDSAELFDFIPKYSKAVIYVKPMNLAKKADLQNLQLKNDGRKEVQKIKDFFTGEMGVDPESAAAYMYDDGMWCVFKVKDADKLMVSLDPENTKIVDGFTVFDCGSEKIAVKDGFGWMISNRSIDAEAVAKAVGGFMNLSDDNTIKAVPGFVKNMSGSDACAYIDIASVCRAAMDATFRRDLGGFSLDDVPHYAELSKSAAYLSADYRKNDLTISCKLLDKDGNNMMGKFGLKDLDKGILKFFDEKATGVAALMIPQEYMEFIVKCVTSQTGGNPMVDNTVRTLFAGMEGNVAIGAKIDDLRDMYANDYTMAIKLKPGADKDIKAMLDGNLSMMGIKADSQGVYAIPVQSNLTVRIGFTGDYMYVGNASSLPEKGYDSSANAAKFGGKSGAFLLDMPQGTALSEAATAFVWSDVGGYIYAWTDDEKAEYTLHINNNPEKNILTNFLTNFIKTKDKMK